MFKNLKIKTKLIGGFIIVVLITVIVGLVGYNGLNKVMHSQDEITGVRLPSIINLQTMYKAQTDIKSQEFGLAIERINDLKSREHLVNRIEGCWKEIDTAWQVYEQLNHTELEVKLWKEFVPKWEAWKEADKKLVQTAIQKNGLLAKGMSAEEQAVKNLSEEEYSNLLESRKLFKPAEQLLKKLVDENIIISEVENKESDSSLASAVLFLVITIAIAVIVALTLGFIISGNITKIIRIIVDETKKLVEAAVGGKLDSRGDPDKINFEFREIIVGINNTLDAVIGPLIVAAEYVDRISKGDIPSKITDDYRGDFNEIKNNLNQCIDAIHALVTDADMLSVAAVEGKLYTRADANKHQGDFRNIINGVNATMSSLVGLIDNMPTPSMIINKDFEVLFMNKAGASLNNTTGEDLYKSKTKCYDHFRTSDCKTQKCACNQSIITGSAASSETDAHPSNYNLDIAYNAVPIKDNKGKVIGAFEVVVDQTSIIQAARTAQKIADYQEVETQKVIDNIIKLSNGSMNINAVSNDADNDTKDSKNKFDSINGALNQCVSAVNTLVSDADMLANSAVEGKLDTRADITKHQGDFRKIVDGFNRTLDAVIEPINESSIVLSDMAKGDLSVKVSGDYKGDHQKLKESINTVNQSLNNLLREVTESVHNTSSASLQISSTAETMAAGSAEQSAQADEVATAVEQMSRTITQNASSATRTAEVAEMNGKIAKEGEIVVDQTVMKMRDIAAVVKKSADNIEKLGESSKQIGEIISVIDDIADQTNLLALNAAIEAARAGDQGRGFAVVADEVRKLAERTTEATKQIASMIKGIQRETTEAVNVMQKGNEEVSNGISLADKAGQSLSEIVKSSQEVQDMITQIAAASEEQSATSEQIAKNVQTISSVSAESARNVQDIATSSNDLAKMTEKLTVLMSKFIIDDGKDSGNGKSNGNGKHYQGIDTKNIHDMKYELVLQ